MRQEAFGHIGLKPTEFYMMTHEDYRLLRYGYADRLKYEEGIIRKQTALICEAVIREGKGVNLVHSNWRIGNEAAVNSRLMAKLKRNREKEAFKKHLNG